MLYRKEKDEKKEKRKNVKKEQEKIRKYYFSCMTNLTSSQQMFYSTKCFPTPSSISFFF